MHTLQSFTKQDNPHAQKFKICANQTCGHGFHITEDIRQTHCSKACAKTEASRRANARKSRLDAKTWTEKTIAAGRMARPERTVIHSEPEFDITLHGVSLYNSPRSTETSNPEVYLVAAYAELQEIEKKIVDLRAKVVEKHDIKFSELSEFLKNYTNR